jgi:hypothetical protein
MVFVVIYRPCFRCYTLYERKNNRRCLMKKLLMAVIAAIIFTVSASAFDPVHGEKFYTLKVKAEYMGESMLCHDACVLLQKDGFMAYCIKGEKIAETFSGIYETEKQAQEAAAVLMEKYGMTSKVVLTSAVSTVPFEGGLLINAPTGIWLNKGMQFKKIFDYGYCRDVRMMIEENKVSISPTGREIVFYFEGAIHKVSLETGKDNILVQGLLNPGLPCRPDPKWSPDGSRIAFMEEYGLGTGAGIRVLKSDGSGGMCLLDNRNSAMHVASFEWHPEKNVIYFVASDAGKRVPVDGKLCMIGLDGKVKDVLVPAAGKEIDRHFKFQGNKIIISENTYRPGMDDNYASHEKVIELN